jgi:hypothetical protein
LAFVNDRSWPTARGGGFNRDNLGHASLAATSLYLHADDDRRHQETEEKHRINR